MASTPARREPKPETPAGRFQLIMEDSKNRLEDIIPNAMREHMTPERIIRLSLVAFNRKRELQDCEPLSILSCIMQAVQLGFEPDDPLGRAFLVPYNEKVKGSNPERWIKVCTLQIGYKGFADLARRTNDYGLIDSRVIYEKDKFDLRYTPAPDFLHEPCMKEDPGTATHVYAYAYLRGSSLPIFEIMTRKDVEAIRVSSKSNDSPAWRAYWGEMAKKVVLKRMLKDQPLSIELEKAMQWDNEVNAVDFDSRPRLGGGNAGLLSRLEPPAGAAADDEDALLDRLAAEESAPAT